MEQQIDHDDELELQNVMELVLEDQGLQEKLGFAMWKIFDQ
jgi:hypothetical protein